LITPNLRERFHREARTAAGLQHPNLVPLYEVGEAGPICFLVSAYCPGPTLADWLRHHARAVPYHETATLVAILGDAVCYAHCHGVVHRDLKPANILLTVDSRQQAVESRQEKTNSATTDVTKHPIPSDLLTTDYCLLSTIPMIADFGLAKQLGGSGPPDDKTLTRGGAVMGTPGYMSPEQARGKIQAIGPATDIYALGAILYELLTGRPPFQGESDVDMLAQVQTEEPIAPSRLRPRVPRDLETICLKCLEKEPRQRYDSAGELAADLRRFLSREPIKARPVGRAERLLRWCRRKPAQAAVVGLTLFALVVLTALAVSFTFAKRLRTEQAQTKLALHEAEKQHILAQQLSSRLAMERGLFFCEQGDAARGMLWLAHSLEIAPVEDRDLERDIRTSLARWHGSLHPLLAMWTVPGRVRTLAVNPTSSTFLRGGDDCTPRLCDLTSGCQIRELPRHRLVVLASAFSPDGRYVVTADDNCARIWEASTGTAVGSPLEHQREVTAVAVSPDGSRVLTGSADGTAGLWEWGRGNAAVKLVKHDGPVRAVAFSPDGKTILTGGDDGYARRWQAGTGKEIQPPLPHRGDVLAVAFSPDGNTILTGTNINTAQVWDALTANPVGEPLLHQNDVLAVAFSPDGKLMATASEDKTARLWDAETHAAVGPPLPHQALVHGVAFCRNGKAILTGGDDGTIRLWKTSANNAFGKPLRHDGLLMAVRFSPDGKFVLTGSLDSTARLWDAESGKELRRLAGHRDGIWAIDFSPDGKLISTGSHDKTARLWQTDTGKAIGQPFLHPELVEGVAFAPDGKSLAIAGRSSVQLWSIETGKPIGPCYFQETGMCPMAFSPDGKILLSGGGDGIVRFVDTRTGEMIKSKRLERVGINAVAFGPDGRTFLTAQYAKGTREEDRAQLWRADTAEPIGKPLLHRVALWSQFPVAFSPDSRIVVTAGEDETARLWDAATGEAIGAPMRHQGKVWAVAFSPDGKFVLTGSMDGTARLWDACTGKPIGTSFTHRGRVFAAAFGADGKKIATACGDNTARLWDLPTAVAGTAEQLRLWAEVITGMDLDEEGVFHVLDGATWHKRRQRLSTLGGAPADRTKGKEMNCEALPGP
jgi:WD40 repeat protein